MQPQKQTLQSRLTTLIKSESLIVPHPYQTSTTLLQSLDYNIQQFQNIQVSQNALIGKICGGIVVSKNQNSKQLLLHLISIYDQNKVSFISCNKFTAAIKDYQLKADLSIFGYLNNFKDIEIGTSINAWIRRIDKRQNNKTFFQMHLNRQPEGKNSNIKLGVIKDNIRIPESVLKVYQQQHRLPSNFLTQYYNDYDNPRLERKLIKGLKIDPIGSLHKISNLDTLEKVGQYFILSRIRNVQEMNWRDEHLDITLELINEGKGQQATQVIKISQKYDPLNYEVLITKSLAHHSIGDFYTTLLSLKKVIDMNPSHQRAINLYERFQQEFHENAVLERKRRIAKQRCQQILRQHNRHNN